MLEIGKQKIVKVIHRVHGTRRVEMDELGQPVTRVTASEVWRVTRDPLGGQFGPDKKRKLVVGLCIGDLLTLRPQGTRQAVSVTLADVYRFALRCRALNRQLEKARATKIKRMAERVRRSLRAADQRLRAAARKDL